jgi:phosphoribosyl 1,2-cyclic phosphate phosphodiesterase
VQTPTASWVIDTGPEFRIQALRAQIPAVDFVLYTHAHADHVTGFDDLRRFSTANGDFMPIYASEGTLQHLMQMFEYAFSGQAQFPGYVRPDPRVLKAPFEAGENEIVPFPVEHGKIETLGFAIRQAGRTRLGYISDCKSISPEGMALLTGADLVILGTPTTSNRYTHLSLSEGIAISRKLKPRKTIFTHLSHEFLHTEVDSTLPETISLAYDGLHLEI